MSGRLPLRWRGPSGARPGPEQGAVALIVVLSSVILFGIAALVIDLGIARAQSNRAQVAADAGALAAADLLASNPSALLADAVARARDYVDANLAESMDWDRCGSAEPLDIQPDGGCVSFDADEPTRVRVFVNPPRQTALFGALFGATGYQVTAAAEARIAIARETPCAPCVEDPPDLALADADGFPVDDLPDLGLLPPDLTTARQVVTDTGCPTEPGAIYGNITLDDRRCDLDAGTYIVTGRLSLATGAELRGNHATIIFACADPLLLARACNPGEEGGFFDGDATSSVTLDENAGDPRGFAVVSVPNNAAEHRLGSTWTIVGMWLPQGVRVAPPPLPGLDK